MAIKTSGTLCASDIRTELGSSGQLCLGSSEARALAGKSSGQICFSDFYGKSAGISTNYTLFTSIYPHSIDASFGFHVSTTTDGSTISISAASSPLDSYLVLDNRGLMFSDVGSSGKVYIYTSSNSFSSFRKKIEQTDVTPISSTSFLNPFSQFASFGDKAYLSDNGSIFINSYRFSEVDMNGWLGEFTGSNSSWSFATKIPNFASTSDPNNYAISDFYATDHAISRDGRTLVTSKWNFQYGPGSRERLDFWTKSGTTWTRQSGSSYEISNIPGSLSSFYYGGDRNRRMSMSADGSVVAIGDPQYGESAQGRVLIFTRSSNTWTLRKNLLGTTVGCRFGTITCVSDDGSTIAIGEPVTTSAGLPNYGPVTPERFTGSVYVYTGSGSSWNLISTLQSPVVSALGGFGTALAMTGGGEVLLIGDPLFQNNPLNEINTTDFLYLAGNQTGYSTGEPFTSDRGAVWVYTKSGNSYVFDKKLREKGITTNTANRDKQWANYGMHLAITPDGKQLVVGVYSVDNQYILSDFGLNSSGFSTQPVYVYRS